MDKSRAGDLFNEDGTVRDFESLVSSSPTDFSGTSTMYYFTPQFEVAEMYAAYAKNRAGVSQVVIIAIAVPNRAIQALQPPRLARLFWPNPDWAGMVWHSRRGRLLPRNLSRYKEAILLIGHIATHPNQVYHNKESPANVAEKGILCVEGNEGRIKAVQFVFSHNEASQQWLWENGAQTAKCFPYQQSDLELVKRRMGGSDGF